MEQFSADRVGEIETLPRDVRRAPWPLPCAPKTLSRWRPRIRRKAQPSFSSCSLLDSVNDRKIKMNLSNEKKFNFPVLNIIFVVFLLNLICYAKMSSFCNAVRINILESKK